MSRVTAGIMHINQELDKISGLDGIVADKIEALEHQVKVMVADILKNHAEANIFDYEGTKKATTSSSGTNMKIKMTCSIGFPGAEHCDEMEFDSAEVQGMSTDEKEEYIIDTYVNPWAQQYLEMWYEEIPDHPAE